MSTPAASVNPRIEIARTRRMLEDTALSAVPGTLVSLLPDLGAAHSWTARVRSTSGEQVTLRLDRILQTIEIEPPGHVARAA